MEKKSVNSFALAALIFALAAMAALAVLSPYKH
jgi:CHASE3 domain sensor protein